MTNEAITYYKKALKSVVSSINVGVFVCLSVC